MQANVTVIILTSKELLDTATELTNFTDKNNNLSAKYLCFERLYTPGRGTK